MIQSIPDQRIQVTPCIFFSCWRSRSIQIQTES